MAAALALALLLVPWNPEMPASGLDSSWRSVIEWGFLRGLDFGSELVFTLGPLGFLYYSQYHPELYPYQLAFWGATAVLIGAFFGAHWGRTPIPVSACLLVALILATGYGLDAWLLMVPLAAALEAMDPSLPRQRWLVWALAVLAIVAGLAKFSVFVAAAAVFLIADVVRMLQRQGVPWLSATLVLGSWLLYWSATGHPGWPAYILGSLEVSGGYSAAMQITGPNAEVWRSVVLGMAVVALLWFTAHREPAGQDVVRRAGVTLAGALIVFMAIKAGIVRHDGHISITAAALLLFAVLGAWRAFDSQAATALKVLSGAVVLGAMYNYLEVSRHWSSAGLWRNFTVLVSDRTQTALGNAKGVVFGDAVARFAARREEALARVRAANPLPKVDGTLDIYNWDQADVLAHGLNYSPRPVFQSYVAYAPKLIERNYAHLAGGSAPDYVLFEPQSLDYRLPSLDDGKSWLLLWSRYDPVTLTDRHVLLKRRASGDRAILAGPERRSRVSWGEPIILENAGNPPCVWAEVDVRENPAGRLRSALFKAPVVEIELEFAGGGSERRRFVPGSGRTGFLVSPLVETANEFAEACSSTSHRAVRRVKRMSLRARGGGRLFFSDDISVMTRGLAIAGGREHAADPDFERMLEWSPIGGEIVRSGAARCGDRWVKWQEGRVLAHASCEIPIARPRGASLEVNFGIFEAAWTQGTTNGVRFEVRAKMDGEWKTIATRDLRPREQEADRRGGRFELELPSGVTQLLLVTDALGDTAWDWSYWGPVREKGEAETASVP